MVRQGAGSFERSAIITTLYDAHLSCLLLEKLRAEPCKAYFGQEMNVCFGHCTSSGRTAYGARRRSMN
jgi:hypothetical protein